ncbi:hypothetical protein SAMN04487948_10125 [Halogranum amylolyticum]|uniref:Uncharacterized protein n=1 Tax=Halogranum amylolyticum TaxID=660520 RepID=A0A1H8MQL5_9EURY|nr:hypothetical protein [Halogranum amylolyticum]SEO19637.1 hypothetical protein SAMN04487948_10125 [Halogranum amylolyticum]
MAENNDYREKLGRRGYLKGIAAAGMGAGVLSSTSGRADAASHDDTHVDGDDIYLVFGAETSEADLDSWVKQHADEIKSNSQQSSSEVIQFQDVSQLNVTQQGAAVAISIDGGEADAIQRTEQNNENTQAGSAQSINEAQQKEKRTFKDVGNAYVVFAEETGCREFSGWVVSDSTYESEQSAEAAIDQMQEVEQANFNTQSAAVAVAVNGSSSQAYQESYQENNNLQAADAVAANIGEGTSQSADSSVGQSQEVDQLNASEQGVAIAIAVGEESVAEACQVSCQYNVNKQLADATAINFDSKSLKEVTAHADMKGDISEKELTHSQNGSDQSNVQAAAATVEQLQAVSQLNANEQNLAVAVAVDDSTATATQTSYQGNFNAQIAEATALNVDAGQSKMSKVVTGKDVKGDDTWAVAYDKGNSQTTQQTAAADITQMQFVEQLNVNEQIAAIAVAIGEGDATAEQVNYQVNQNVQQAQATAGNPKNGC